MADKHPYTSGTGGLVAAVTHLRKSFPQKVSAETFKKLGIAPNNETYIVNILRFLSVIDAEGNKTKTAGAVFVKHDEEEFQQGFANLVTEAYASLFELHGPNAWNTPTDKLISFFRNSDQTSDIVGRRQANTFQTLASISGKLDSQVGKPVASKAKKPDIQSAKKRQAKAGQKAPSPAAESATTTDSILSSSGGGQNRDSAGGEMALTVRIEINLPANGDKETYDNIFRSIRENLLNGKSA